MPQRPAPPSTPHPPRRRDHWRWAALTLAAAALSGSVTYTLLRDVPIPHGGPEVPYHDAPAPDNRTLALQALPGPNTAPTAPEAPSPSPLLVQARRLQGAGQLTEAAHTYQAVVAQDPRSPEAAAALLAYGQTQFALRRYDEAGTAFLRVLVDYRSSAARGEAVFWQGKVAEARGDASAAGTHYLQAANLLPHVEAYVRVQAARVLAAAGDMAGALAQLERAAQQPATAALRQQIAVTLADLTDKVGNAAGAAQRFRDLLDRTQNPWERSDYQYRLADVIRRAGDEDQARQLLLDLLLRYPATANASKALEALKPRAGELDALLEGTVAYYQRDNARAAAALQRALRDPNADQARARYFLGLLALREGRDHDALGWFDQVLAEYGNHALAEDVRWERAQLFEGMGRLRDALAAYRELRQAFPNGQQAGEAGFREGLVLYKLRDLLGAAAAWVQAQDGAAIPVRTRNLFWAGKALALAGDRAGAQRLWQEAAGLRPGNYYADRAQTMLNGGGGPIPLTPVALPVGNDPTAEAQQIETWLASWAAAGPPLPSVAEVRRALLGDERFRRGDALLALGLRAQAVEEFRELRAERRRDPVAQAALLSLFRERDLYHLAASAAYALLDLSGQSQTQAPEAVQRTISPAPFAELLNQEAVSRGIDPFLFLALIQQESAFDTGARSSAQALGLTQVMPATGRELARQLGLRDFEPDDLLRPIVSLRFGAQYLAEQLRRFNGEAMAALAAYNAGPGAAQRWMRAAGGDVDLFVEEIDYAQTSTYVKKIAESAARYRTLYGRNS